MLLEIVERRSSETNRKSVVHRLKCDFCSLVIERSSARANRGLTHFCGNKCRGAYRRDHRELWEKSIAIMHSPDVRKRAIANRDAKYASGEKNHPWLGRKHSEETRQSISRQRLERGTSRGEKNGMYGRSHSKATRERMSDAKSRLILAGKFKAYGTNNKKGNYTSIKTGATYFFRSSWEEALMKHLDADERVAVWEYESVRLPYVYDNHKRWYVPDFIVTYVDGTKRILEVKPREFVNAEKTLLKAQAGEKWCQENGATYVTVTKQVMVDWGVLLP